MRRVPLLITLLGVSVAIVFSASLLRPSAVPAQSPRQAPAATTPGETVKIFVSARDNKGRAVSDLSPQDLQIIEKQKPQEIVAIHSPALVVGLLFDTSKSLRTQAPEVTKESIRGFLEEILRAHAEVFVMGFSDAPRILARPTRDLPTILPAVEQATALFGGATSFYDTLEFVSTELAADESVAHVLIVVSDCRDTASRIDLRRAIEVTRRARTRLYVLVTERPLFMDKGLQLNDVANRLGSETGGRAYRGTSEYEIRDALAEITQELQGHYLVEFQPSNPARDDKFHNVRVKSLRKDLRVSAPPGYFWPQNP